MSAVYLKPDDVAAWLGRQAQEAPDEAWGCFAGATVEEACCWPEQGRLRLTLGLAQVAEESGPFLILRKALGGMGMAEAHLKVRYPEGSLGLSEYLALHFDDLCASLRFDLALEPHWTGGLDYEVAEDESAS